MANCFFTTPIISELKHIFKTACGDECEVVWKRLFSLFLLK